MYLLYISLLMDYASGFATLLFILPLTPPSSLLTSAELALTEKLRGPGVGDCKQQKVNALQQRLQMCDNCESELYPCHATARLTTQCAALSLSRNG
jgi:hypothetical protein